MNADLTDFLLYPCSSAFIHTPALPLFSGAEGNCEA